MRHLTLPVLLATLAACAPDSFTDGDGDSDVASSGDASDARLESATEASHDAQVSADGCVLTTYYLDLDGDGFGGSSTVVACVPPDTAWVTTGGDCDDSNPIVHPAQTSFFTVGYMPPAAMTLSFDYNCDGMETESGNSTKADCAVSFDACANTGGYVEAQPVRSGVGVDPYCGSASTVTCTYKITTCPASAPMTASTIACH